MIRQYGNQAETRQTNDTSTTLPLSTHHANTIGARGVLAWPISSESSVALYLALKKHKVPAELHVYASGGHGYGMRKVPHPCATWPQRAAEWMQSRGYLSASGTGPK